ncbi:hypothetical protein BGZ65_007012, partial [Modicella reniformis]
PFVRKYFIRSREQFEASNSLGTSWSSGSTGPFGTSTSSHCSLRTLSRSTLNRIKILDLEETRQLNPPKGDPNLISESAVSEVPGFKEVIAQSYNDADEDDDDDGDYDVDMISVSRHKYNYE